MIDGSGTADRRPVVLGRTKAGRIRWVASRRSSRPMVRRPGRCTRSRSGGSSRTRRVPARHSHPEDDVFYVLAGTMSVLVGTEWVEAVTGSFVLVPGNITHDFENRSSEKCRDAQRLGSRHLRGAYAGYCAIVRGAPSRRHWRLRRGHDRALDGDGAGHRAAPALSRGARSPSRPGSTV